MTPFPQIDFTGKSNLKNWEKDGELEKLDGSGDVDFVPINAEDEILRFSTLKDKCLSRITQWKCLQFLTFIKIFV